MQFDHFDSHQMKENIDANITNHHNNQKNAHTNPQKPIKNQLFGQRNSFSNNEKKIKKTAYIVDSDEEQTHKVYISNKPILSHRSIDDVSQIIESLSRESSIPTSPKVTVTNPIGNCSLHQSPIYIYNFCLECSTYLMCNSCLQLAHSSHMILSFSTQAESKKLTKQFLIQKMQQTLQNLKSKENDIKNKTYEMEMIMKNIKKQEQDLMNKLQGTFIELQNMIRNYYQDQISVYESKIDNFFGQYNHVGDELRENLLSIIEQSFDIRKFTPSMITKQPPGVPNQHINKFKSKLQKTKKFYKVLGQNLDEIKEKCHCAFLSKQIKNNGKQNAQMNQAKRNPKNSINKYQKFLNDNCFGKEENNKSSLMKILNSLSQ